MSERLPRITSHEIIKVLERFGFFQSRSSGSHHIFRNKFGRRVTVPVHSGKIIHPKILKSILKDMELSVDDLKKELKKKK